MFKKVLAALDLSDADEAVFESALERAIATHPQLMRLHALVGEHSDSCQKPAVATKCPRKLISQPVDELAASNS